MRKLLALLCCLEILYITFLVNTAGPFLSPVILFGVSVGIAWCYLKLSTGAYPMTAGREMNKTIFSVLQWAAFAALFYFTFSWLKHFWWYDKTYGDPTSKSDIIPQLNVLVTRFLAGEQPYQLISFGDYSLFPTYMPFQWAPYLLTELVKKDYRWIPAFAMWAMSLYYYLRHRNDFGRQWWAVIIPVWPLILWGEFMMHDRKIFVFTVEGLIAAYYLFVAESTRLRSVVPLAIGIGICLLSRYSIVFWVPLCAFLFFIGGRKKDALILCAVPLVMIALFYWFPFMRRDSSIFLQGYNYHTNAAYYEWIHDLQGFGGEVYVYNGLGFSSYAMKFFSGDVAAKVLAYKNVHFAACILCVTLLGWIYYRHRAKYELKAFVLFSLKVYITVFYTFIQIPYKYLFFVPMAISASLLAAGLSVKNDRILKSEQAA